MKLGKKICICGGGALGHTIAAYLANKGYEVGVLTNRPGCWNHELVLHDDIEGELIGSLRIVTDDPSKVIPCSDLILLCLPGFAISPVLNKIKPYLNEDIYVGSIVSSSGFFFMALDLLPDNIKLFGFQRVPFVARVKEYGKSAYSSGHRKKLFLATYRFDGIELSRAFADVFNVSCVLCKHYLEVALTNSNPILHPSRLYDLFKEYQEGGVYQTEFYFYQEWSETSSEILINCDNEFQKVRSCFSIDRIATLLEHYESVDALSMTKKIRSISSLVGIKAPMKKVSNGYIPDFENRYFVEDVPYGLLIIKVLASHLNIVTPTIDKILLWVQKFMKEEYVYTDLITSEVKVKKYIFDPYYVCKSCLSEQRIDLKN